MAISSKPEVEEARALDIEQRRARARGPMRLQVRIRSGEMEVETESRLAAGLRARETRARAKARVETAFKADAGSVADLDLFCLQLGASGLGGDLFGRGRIVSQGGIGGIGLLCVFRG